MTSEIRANTLKNRVGLGTVSFTNTGPIVSGIVTIANSTSEGVTLEDNAGVGNSLKITTPTGYVSIGSGNATFVHLNTDRGVFYFQKRIFVDEGIIGSYDEDLVLQSPSNTNRITINKTTGLVSIVNDLDVDGHTNLDNVSVAGVSTFTGNADFSAGIDVTGNAGVSGNISVGGVISIPDTIQHVNDTNTKIRFPAVDTVSVETAGTERLRIEADGGVNIGAGSGNQSTLAPLLQLHKASSAATAYLHITNTDSGITNNDGLVIGFNGSNDALFFNKESTPIRFATAGTERVRIHATGELQIGDSTKSSLGSRLLQIGKTDRTDTYIELRTSTSGVGGIVFSDGTASNDSGYRGTIEYAHGGSNSDSMYFKTAAQERLRIDSNGRLSFAGDTDTYIWHPSANQLAITRGGSSFPIVRFGTGGQGGTVGFATDGNLVTSGEIISVRGYSSFKSVNNLYAALYTHNEQQGSGNICAHILLNVNGANRGGFGYDTDNSTLIMGNHNAISFRTGVTNLNGTERLLIKNTGGVGISTNKIRNSDFLHIATASQDFTNPTEELMDGGGICFQNTDTLATTGKTLPGIFWATNTNELGRARAGIIGVSANNHDAADIVFLAKYLPGGEGIYPRNERMRITNTGKVGINSTTPQQALDVRGSINGGSENQPFQRFHDSHGDQRATKHYFRCTKGGTTTFDILTVDLNTNFHQALVVLYYGARIQNISDSVTYPVHKVMGVNRFNGGSVQFTKNTIAQNANATNHADIDVVATSSTQYRIRLTFSGTAGGSSFAAGYVEIIGLGPGTDGAFYSLAHGYGITR